MMPQPLFTVATITYNSSKYVRQAIESVLASSFTDFEYLISDDCSTDDTWQIIQEYSDSRIKAWKNDINLGEYSNRNKVVDIAVGRYLLYVDGDDVLYKYTLRNLSEYTLSFPNSGMIWGLNPQHFPFFIFPYEVSPEENIKLIYCTHIPIASIGFGEILFKTSELKKNGGFSTLFRIGDTYIKKKMALTVPVLYVNIGFMFWRQSPNQSSKSVAIGIAGFLERAKIDNLVINDHFFPGTLYDQEWIRQNVKISQIKLFVKNTILKGNLSDFFRYKKAINLSILDLFFLFKKGKYTYSPSQILEEPLYNDFNLK